MTDNEVKAQVIMLVVFAATFLVLAVWLFRQASSGRWAVLGATGAALIGISEGITAASDFENVFLESAHIALNLLVRDHVYTVLILAQAAGAVLLAAAFAVSRRTPSGRDGIYGP